MRNRRSYLYSIEYSFLRVLLLVLLPVIGLLSVGLVPCDSYAQTSSVDSKFGQMLADSKYGILSNSIANLQANGDSLWVGPYLNMTTNEGQSWRLVESDSLFGSSNRVFSIDVIGNLVVAGLGNNDLSTGDNVQTAAGFLVSEDDGSNFDYRFPQLDQPTDTTVVYGSSLLGALAIIVPQQSPPFDVSIDPWSGEIWVAGWASGIRRSSDLGRTWTRVVLPPDNLDFIHPDSTYSFRLEPQRGGSGSLNHLGFSVLVADSGTIWAGTAGGVNRSMDGGSSWRRFKAEGTSSSLTGSWVISIEEQRYGSESTVWMATWNTSEVAGEQFGVTYTDDQGESFHQALRGERIYDFAFDGLTVYAAGENGLFISRDGGSFWRSVSEFRDRTRSERIVRPGSSVFSVEVTRSAVWVGTGDGLLRSTDGGVSWELHRTEVPLHPTEPDDLVPDVETFAYPNPFSPAADQFIRIRYELAQASNVDIRIFDFGMNLVRTVEDSVPSGISDTRWDGRGDDGTRVANGAYFYEIRAGNARFRGKILVIE